mmetsp:Transcript_79237/g.157553  ORF Transcript_79237/g.157553 Transcript_79237/m.157553 type:complete len:217 (+) Transcript_79237:668-1318(+)
MPSPLTSPLGFSSVQSATRNVLSNRAAPGFSLGRAFAVAVAWAVLSKSFAVVAYAWVSRIASRMLISFASQRALPSASIPESATDCTSTVPVRPRALICAAVELIKQRRPSTISFSPCLGSGLNVVAKSISSLSASFAMVDAGAAAAARGGCFPLAFFAGRDPPSCGACTSPGRVVSVALRARCGLGSSTPVTDAARLLLAAGSASVSDSRFIRPE